MSESKGKGALVESCQADVWTRAAGLFRNGEGFGLQSRVHRLAAAHMGGKSPLFLKRDDELGGLTGGSKWRKWAAIITEARAVGITDMVLIGSARSAFVLAGMMQGKAAGFSLHAFLLSSASPVAPGLETYFQLARGESPVHWLTRAQWPEVETLAQAEAERLSRLGRHVLVLPEGGCHPYAWAGGLTLAWDLARHMEDEGWGEADIWMDAGTGLSAALAIAGARKLGLPVVIHVVGMAAAKEAFTVFLTNLAAALGFADATQVDRWSWTYHRPQVGRSFGSVPARVLHTVTEVAGRFGVMLDPLYGAKAWPLFWESVETARPRVFVHSGGGLSLPGLCSVTDTRQGANPKPVPRTLGDQSHRRR